MLWFNVVNDRVTEITEQLLSADFRKNNNWISRNDIKSFEAAEAIAASATELTGDLYVATNRPNCYPQFDVIRAPKVGDDVSYAFNGDFTPCGKITKISKTLKKVVTSEGKTFYRVKETGTWLHDRMWSIVNGHISRRNQEF